MNRRRWRDVAAYAGLAVVAVLQGLPGLVGGTPRGDDLAFHAYRHRGVVNALRDGQLLPQLDPSMIGGFGYAPNLFYGPLTSYGVALVRLVTPSWSAAINVFLILTVLASGLIMLRFVDELSGSRPAGFVAGVLYMAAPYHLADLWQRQANGEAFAFVFVPLVFHGVWRIGRSRSGGAAMLGVGAAGLALCHNLSAAITVIFLVAYLALDARRYLRRRQLLRLLYAAGLAVGLSAFFLLPLLEAEHALRYAAFATDSEFFRRYVATVGEHALRPAELFLGNPVSIGWALLLAVLPAMILPRRLPVEWRRTIWSFVGLGAAAAVLATTLVPWHLLPRSLWYIQFPWRMLLPVDFFFSAAGGMVITGLLPMITNAPTRRRVLAALVLIGVAVGCNAVTLGGLTAGPHVRLTFSYRLSANGSAHGLAMGEYLPDTLAGAHGRVPAIAHRGRAVKIISGAAVVSGRLPRDSSHLNFSVRTTRGAVVEVPRVYYPGYQGTITIGSTRTRAEISPSHNGFVAITVPAAASTQTVRLHFGMSPATRIGVGITALAGLGLLGSIILRRAGTRSAHSVRRSPDRSR